jgi:gamma-glutamylcyclotransferase (GGCT)/AIG2-like uncharacterized protein YtfP
MSQSLYAFYGSLRRGMRLHKQFKNSLHYSHSAWLRGYDLHSLGNYPIAVKSSDKSHKILVEVMRISDAETEKSIRDIEMEAGYYAEKIQVGDDLVTIFLFDGAANNLRIDSGDWVIFFGQ